ncbi:MAG: hypothetical protein KAU36_03900 [candidate division Zixibacteria bacterium]|nr:hypothetical protein [candidate division Zixibacteria bacterium]
MTLKSKAMTVIALLLTLLFVGGTSVNAQTCDGGGKNFVDLDGDGFNDNARDADGDGIPNGLDPDYVKGAKDGEGYKNGFMHAWTFQHQAKQDGLSQSRARWFHQLKAEANGNIYRYGGFGTGNGDGNMGETGSGGENSDSGDSGNGHQGDGGGGSN